MAANREKEPGDSPEEATTAAVREALEQLDARDQEVIMLRAAGESTFDEIGKILGLSPVRWRHDITGRSNGWKQSSKMIGE